MKTNCELLEFLKKHACNERLIWRLKEWLFDQIVIVQPCFSYALIPTGVLVLATTTQSMIGASTQKKSGVWMLLTDLILKSTIVEVVGIYGKR